MLAGLEKADGANQAFRRNSSLLKAKAEFRGLRFRADQAEKRDVLSLEHALHDLEIERVAVGHDEIERAGRRFVDHPGWLFLNNDFHVLSD